MTLLVLLPHIRVPLYLPSFFLPTPLPVLMCLVSTTRVRIQLCIFGMCSPHLPIFFSNFFIFTVRAKSLKLDFLSDGEDSFGINA